MMMTLQLGAGGVFIGAGDAKWLTGALGVKEVIGYKILESEVSSVHGHKYWAYKPQVLDVKNIINNLNIEDIRKLTNEIDLSNARKLLPPAIKDSVPVYYLSKKFHQYYDDIFIVTPAGSSEAVIYIVFSAEPFSLTE